MDRSGDKIISTRVVMTTNSSNSGITEFKKVCITMTSSGDNVSESHTRMMKKMWRDCTK